MRFLLFVLTLFVPVAAQAQGMEVLCNSLPEHHARADAEFVPGRDDVVPADINPLNANVPAVIDIPINVQLVERFPDLDIPSDLELEPTVSMISIHQSGRVVYNGQDISKRVYTACEQIKADAALDKPDALSDEMDGVMDGQGAEDALNSDTVIVKDGVEAEVLEPKASDK